jgi:Zn-finger protein
MGIKATGESERRKHGSFLYCTYLQYKCDCGKVFFSKRGSRVRSCGCQLPPHHRKEREELARRAVVEGRSKHA